MINNFSQSHFRVKKVKTQVSEESSGIKNPESDGLIKPGKSPLFGWSELESLAIHLVFSQLSFHMRTYENPTERLYAEMQGLCFTHFKIHRG